MCVATERELGAWVQPQYICAHSGAPLQVLVMDDDDDNDDEEEEE
jgi:hypothetical protein